MTDVKMNEVPAITDLSQRSVLEPSFVGPVIKGGGDINYLCAGCGQILLEGVTYKQVMDLTIKCGKCRKYNEIPRSHYTH